MANHHPAPDLLTAFSAGTLHLGQALCIATHLESCAECRTNLQRLNSIGATLFAQQDIQPVSENLKTSVMAHLDDPVQEKSSSAPVKASLIPRALRQFIPGDYNNLKWKKLSPSIKAVTLCVDVDGTRVEMVRIKPGGKVATHTHTGDEMTLVLEGSFSDETGIFREGDFVLLDERHHHKPMATKDRECICLTATSAPVRFTGFLGRLFNPLIRKRYLPV